MPPSLPSGFCAAGKDDSAVAPFLELHDAVSRFLSPDRHARLRSSSSLVRGQGSPVKPSSPSQNSPHRLRVGRSTLRLLSHPRVIPRPGSIHLYGTLRHEVGIGHPTFITGRRMRVLPPRRQDLRPHSRVICGPGRPDPWVVLLPSRPWAPCAARSRMRERIDAGRGTTVKGFTRIRRGSSTTIRGEWHNQERLGSAPARGFPERERESCPIADGIDDSMTVNSIFLGVSDVVVLGVESSIPVIPRAIIIHHDGGVPVWSVEPIASRA